MNISNHYWYFKSALTPKFCDDVIAYANQQKEEMARTGGFNNKNKLNNVNSSIKLEWFTYKGIKNKKTRFT